MASNDSRNRVEIGLATLMAALALAVSAWSAYWQREQARAQTWPQLSLDVDHEIRGVTTVEGKKALESGALRVHLVNNGVGPAIVHRFECSYDDKPIDCHDMLFKLRGDEDSTLPLIDANLSHAVLAPGARQLFVQYNDPLEAMNASHLLERTGFSVCYCSVLDRCWWMKDEISKPTRSCD